MKRLFCLLFTFFSLLLTSVAQNDPVKWKFTSVPLNAKEVKLTFTVNLEEGWHIYSQFLEEGGPMPTTFTFQPDSSYELKGKVNEESEPVKRFDPTFMMEVIWFEKIAVFTQVIKLNAPAATVKGKVEFMGCNEFMCLPPGEVAFNIDVKTDTSLKKKN